jgi:hypothetical protein
MFTLSQASYDTKEILKWGGLFIAGLVVIIVFIQMFLIVKEAIFPTPPPKPTVTFSKLDPQLFPESVTDKKFIYKINTLTGFLPSFPNQVKVFKIKTFTPDLLSLQNAKTKVAAAGFVSGPIQISNINYEWTNTDDATGLTRKMDMDIVDNNFTLNSDFISNKSMLSSNNVTNKNDSIAAVTSYLEKINPLPDDIDTGKTKVVFFSIQNGTLTPVTSLADSKMVEVSLFQKDINDMPIAYEKPDSSSLNFLVGPGAEIVQGQYFYQTPTKESATYPIKSSTQAYANLQNGIAYIASYDGSSTSISINNAFLAYYMSSESQNFLMPIIVFQGNDNFTAYVPAVTDEWINK